MRLLFVDCWPRRRAGAGQLRECEYVPGRPRDVASLPRLFCCEHRLGAVGGSGYGGKLDGELEDGCDGAWADRSMARAGCPSRSHPSQPPRRLRLLAGSMGRVAGPRSRERSSYVEGACAARLRGRTDATRGHGLSGLLPHRSRRRRRGARDGKPHNGRRSGCRYTTDGCRAGLARGCGASKHDTAGGGQGGSSTKLARA